jgi:hypothetical protein
MNEFIPVATDDWSRPRSSPRIRFRLPADLVLFAEAAVAAVVLVGMTSRAPEPAPEPAAG